MFMIAGARPDVFGDVLWPIATQEPFSLCNDTRKDAIDFTAATYTARTIEERQAFEASILGIDLSSSSDPEEAREQLTCLIFGAIGTEHLATEEARKLVQEQPSHGSPDNERPFKISNTSRTPEKWWWLRSVGVDLQDPVCTSLLEHAERVEAALGFSSRSVGGTIGDVGRAMILLQELETATEQAEKAGIPLDVLRVPGNVLARGCEAIASASPERLTGQDTVLVSVIAMTVKLAAHPSPEAGPEEEASYDRSPSWNSPAPRIDAARTIMQLCRRCDSPEKVLLETVEALASDPHPAVRMMVGQSLSALWNTSRPLMWKIAKVMAREEHNRSVVRAFMAGFLRSVGNADPEQTEALVIAIREHIISDPRDDEQQWKTRRDSGGLVAKLWVDNERPQSRDIVDAWSAQPLHYAAELSGVLSIVRSRLILGYQSDSPAGQSIRQRTQDIVAKMVTSAAAGLESFYVLDSETRDAQADSARTYLQLLDQACNELFFASGAFGRSEQGENHGLQSEGEKGLFFEEVDSILLRIGDVGSPSTIYRLIDLLSFLAPVDPGRAFDTTANALLEGGQRLGYQFEALGANSFTKLVGYFLADHRRLFDDDLRRRKLVDCLDVFIEAGWPPARRLLYQLPDILR